MLMREIQLSNQLQIVLIIDIIQSKIANELGENDDNLEDHKSKDHSSDSRAIHPKQMDSSKPVTEETTFSKYFNTLVYYLMKDRFDSDILIVDR